MEVTRLGPNPPAFADALKSVNHADTVSVLESTSLETAVDLKRRGLLKDSDSILIAVLPAGSNDLTEATAYHRVSLQTEVSKVRFDK